MSRVGLFSAGLVVVLVLVTAYCFWRPPQDQSELPATTRVIEETPSGVIDLATPVSGSSKLGDRSDPDPVDLSAEGNGKRVVYESSLEFLESYWGERWPALRDELALKNPDELEFYESLQLTEDLIPPPLSEVHEEIVRRLLEEFDSEHAQRSIAFHARAEAWPDELTAEFLEERVGANSRAISPEQLAHAQRVADDMRRSIEDARNRFFDAARFDIELEAKAGAYVAWPLIHVGAGTSPSTGAAPLKSPMRGSVVNLGISLNGLWIVTLNLSSAGFPHLVELKTSLARLGERRLREVSEALAQ